jgi:hypothetical protein
VRILVITSCTGQKTVAHGNALAEEDFAKGSKHVAKRETELSDYLTPAEELYSGQQHVRLMRGVQATKDKLNIDLHIVSAGYGLVPGDRKIAPYECTFTGRGKKDLANWASGLNIPKDFRKLISKPYDLALLLLGDDYLSACQLDDTVKLGGPTIGFCGNSARKRLPDIPSLRYVTVSNPEAKRFSCGLVSLKGELASRILESIATDAKEAPKNWFENEDLLSALDRPLSKKHKESPPSEPENTEFDKVIDIPKKWLKGSESRRLRYFIPEWDDQVDLDYDFEHDTHSGGRGHWGNQVYAHQMYQDGPRYDGILVSRVVAEKGKKKAKAVNELGIHRYLRVPREYMVMGDCGAFDYITEKEPPFTTEDVVDYYTRLGFDMGVSVDHLVVPAFETENQFRYDLTIRNARDFIKLHRKRKLQWTPIGAVQGWDPDSYAKAAAEYVKMGYDYIGLGGLVRSTTSEVIDIVRAVRAKVPASMRIHLFGLARFAAIRAFADLGVTSIDSASMLRKAWLGNNLNYLTRDGWYPAIRVPQAAKEDPKHPGKMRPSSFRAKRLIDEGLIDQDALIKLEHACLSGLAAYGASKAKKPSPTLLRHLVEYDTLLAGVRPGTEDRIRRVLEARPWDSCGCDICRTWGIQVVIFRGNNRNRRRGFHNTHVFYEMTGQILKGKRFSWFDEESIDDPKQLDLVSPVDLKAS